MTREGKNNLKSSVIVISRNVEPPTHAEHSPGSQSLGGRQVHCIGLLVWSGQSPITITALSVSAWSIEWLLNVYPCMC